jgi:hypothetical protein
MAFVPDEIEFKAKRLPNGDWRVDYFERFDPKRQITPNLRAAIGAIKANEDNETIILRMVGKNVVRLTGIVDTERMAVSMIGEFAAQMVADGRSLDPIFERLGSWLVKRATRKE